MKKFCGGNGHKRFDGELARILDGIGGSGVEPVGLIIPHHNFIRSHMVLGKTPAAAEISQRAG